MKTGRVWVTGAGGLIGSHLVRLADRFASGLTAEPVTRDRVDLCHLEAVTSLFARQPPAAVIHCAALGRAAACEANPAEAQRLNVSVTQHLSRLAQDIPFFFLSTDHVFDGRQGDYSELDPIHPLSVYAQTKARAEDWVLQNSRHTVIRLALNLGVSPTGDRSVTELMRQAARRGERLRLFHDEFRSPLPAVVTARVLWELVRMDRPGLYHLGGSERLSRWEVGCLVAARWPELQGKIERASLKDYSGPPRPADVSLNSAKVQALLSFRLPGLTEWLAAHPGEPV